MRPSRNFCRGGPDCHPARARRSSDRAAGRRVCEADATRRDLTVLSISSFMKVVILCGGKGTRLREETEFRPKPMVPIGDRPILWHIMKTYASHGYKEFILCLGYKGDMI